MRSFVWFTGPLLSLPLLFLFSTERSAHAETSTVTIGRAASVHLGGMYVGSKIDDAETRGRRLVTSHVEIAPSALVTTGVDRFADGETIVRYAQTHRGLPIIGRGASVRLSRSNQPIATTVALETENDLPSNVTPRVTHAEAASVAAAVSAVGASSADAHLVIWPTFDRGARLAWAVLPRVPVGIPMAPRVIVDAETREVLEVRNMLTFAKANVFASNPVKTPTASAFDLPMSVSGANLTNDFVQATNCIDNKTVRPVSFYGFNLDVHVCDLVQVASTDGNGDFVYEPSDNEGSTEARTDPFSEVSMYFHASKAYEFFRGLSGDPSAQVVADKPLRVIANLQMPAGLLTGEIAKAGDPDLALQPFQNAFFAPAAGGLGEVFQQLYGFQAGALWFGQGPKRDYAYDGDVVYHELTHAVVDATLKLGAWHIDARGAIDSPGAMNEGLADYFSSAITGDPDVGEYAAQDMGVAPGLPIRTLANQDNCSSLVGEVHDDSTLFSGALWTARVSLGEEDRAKFDSALYKAMRANPGAGDLGFEDLAKLFITTLATDLPAGATALEKSMTDRAILPGCERIETYTGTPRRSREARRGFTAPGKSVANVKGIAPGIFQLTAPIPENTASVTVSFTVRAAPEASSPLGGNAKPFTPIVLAKIGAPITWSNTAKEGHDAAFKIAAEEASGGASAVINLPEGSPAGPIYVQIASTGDSDGSYDNVALAFTPRAVDVVEPPPVPPGEDATVPAADDGCSVGRAHGTHTTTELAPLLAAVGLVASAFRRRDRRRTR